MSGNTNMLDNGDPVSSGDNGGFGRPQFGPGERRGIIEIVKHQGEDAQFGGEPVAEEELVKTVRARLAAEGIEAGYVEIGREGRDLVLRGVVATNDLCGIAESVARGTPGVTSVVNELSVDPTV